MLLRMAQEMVGLISKVEWLFRQVLLNAKVAKIGRSNYCIHHISDLQEIKTNQLLEDKGVVNFQAKAEIYFVPKSEGGVSYSTGDRLIIKGVVEWKDNNWTIVDPLIIENEINTWNLKRCEEDEYSEI